MELAALLYKLNMKAGLSVMPMATFLAESSWLVVLLCDERFQNFPQSSSCACRGLVSVHGRAVSC